jgi:uncharacterized protein
MIHKYKLNGFNMIVDAASGAVHSVDEVAYDAIARLDELISQADGGAKAVLGNEEVMKLTASELPCTKGKGDTSSVTRLPTRSCSFRA